MCLSSLSFGGVITEDLLCHQRDLLIMLILYLKLIIDYQLDLFNYLNMLSPSQTWSILLFPTSRALVFLISSALYQVELYGVFM